MKLAYYPGCSGQGTSKEYEISTRAVCRALGLDMKEMNDWSCCGSSPAHSMDVVLSGALAARNLGIAAKEGAEAVLTPCPSCLANLKLARHRMQKPGFKAQVDELLDEPSPENLPETFSVLQVLLEQVGLDKIREKAVRPLEGMKVATYYGCLMSRPVDVMKFDDPENPVAMDKIMEALGAEVVLFPMKVECCGASSGIANKDMTASLTGRILESAKAFGAEAVVVACPLCHMNLDLRQKQAEGSLGQNIGLPVFYYTQLLGLALGLASADLCLEKLVVSPDALLTGIAERRSARLRRESEGKKGAAS